MKRADSNLCSTAERRIRRDRERSVVKRRFSAVFLATIAVLGVSCGGGSTKTSAAKPSGSKALAKLGVISTDVTVKAGSAPTKSGTSGQPLAVGDTVGTDPSGFAEVGFFDGSLTRVDHAAEFTLTDLQDAESAKVVHTELGAGRSFNRIKKLSESQTWEQDTPVASATVRGTAFAVDCTLAADSCTFTVLEGVVELKLPDGTRVTLKAGQRVTLTKGKAPGKVESPTAAELAADPWIKKNVDYEKAHPAGGSTTTTPSSATIDYRNVDPCNLLTSKEVIAIGNHQASTAPGYVVDSAQTPEPSTQGTAKLCRVSTGLRTTARQGDLPRSSWHELRSVLIASRRPVQL